jgi:DNA-binding transcriptional LysR family regulator
MMRPASVIECFDWNGFRFFLAVARAGQLSRASKTLGVDVATVSRHLTQFETSIGARLFERSPSGYALSEMGRQMLVSAEQIEGTILRLPCALTAETSVAQRVKIGAPHGFGDYFLARRLADLCDHHPGLDPEIMISSEPHSLAKREVDLNITTTCPREGRLFSRKLTDFSAGLYASQSYLDSHAPLRRADDVREHTLIGTSDDSMPADGGLDAIVPRFRSSNLSVMINAVLGGAGLCMLPDFVADQHDGLVRVLPKIVSAKRGLWLVVHADMREDARVRAVSSFILSQVRAERNFFLRTAARDQVTMRPGTWTVQPAVAAP